MRSTNGHSETLENKQERSENTRPQQPGAKRTSAEFIMLMSCESFDAQRHKCLRRADRAYTAGTADATR